MWSKKCRLYTGVKYNYWHTICGKPRFQHLDDLEGMTVITLDHKLLASAFLNQSTWKLKCAAVCSHCVPNIS